MKIYQFWFYCMTNKYSKVLIEKMNPDWEDLSFKLGFSDGSN